MKKIMIILSALALSSCTTEVAVKDFRGTTYEVFDRIVHFSYKSHDYIIFRDGSDKYSVAGVVHDPDCQCKKEETK
jgi:hypothetical protein